jgi:putative DNA primase/helicase
MIEGCLLYQEEGLQPPERVLKASSAYLSEQDVVSEFIKHAFEFRESGRLMRRDIGWALGVYLKENGHSKSVKAPKIYKKLEEVYGLSKDEWYQGSRAFHGVSITPDFWEVLKRHRSPDDEPLPRDGLRGLKD